MTLLYLSGLSVLLVLSAFFSACEAALFSLSPNRVRRLISERARFSGLLARLTSAPQRTLINILLGNTLVNVGASFFAALLSFRIVDVLGIDQAVGMAAGVGVMTLLLLVLGEITPKWYSIERAESVSLKGSPFLFLFSFLCWPISLLLELVVSAGLRGLPKRSLVTMDEIKAMLEMEREAKTLRAFEEEIIRNVFDFSGTIVREIMTPRSELFALKRDATISEARDLARRKRHSRVPIYDDNMDDIVGILYMKDILTTQVSESGPVLHLARAAYFVPETMPVSVLLDEFQKRRVHFAVVVDEHGGTVGAVTLDDILGEIVGDITEGQEACERAAVTLLSERKLVADGHADLDDVKEKLQLEVHAEQFKTVSGLIYGLAGRVPAENEEFVHQGLKYVVLEMRGRRIVRVRITRLE